MWFMMIQIIVLKCLLLTIFITVSSNLQLDKLEALGINGNTYISDIVVYFNKVYLTIPRTMCLNNVSNPTLVEAPWKEFNVILKTRFNKPVSIDGQIWAKCDDLQNAVALAKEGIKSKLWILDRGNQFCPAKVVAYSMFQNTFLDEQIDLSKVPRAGLVTILVENGSSLGDHRAFIANAGHNTLLMCHLNDVKCQYLKIVEKDNPLIPINVDFLSISKSGSKMYLTGTKLLGVYLLDLGTISVEPDGTNLYLNVTNLGETLGPSSGLEVDLKQGLIYYLVRDYALVRWSTGKPMQAEYHEILGQSFKRLPYVSRIFTDPQGSIYALVNPFSAQKCKKEVSDDGMNIINDPLERVVKIMTYNFIFDKFEIKQP